jgi:hypothetical protein
VRQAYAAVSALNRELIDLQQSNASFAAALEAAGSRGELADIKRRLEAHQTLLGQWEEKVARQLEVITELQSPSRRHSTMLVSAGSRALLSAVSSSSAALAALMAASPGPSSGGYGGPGATHGGAASAPASPLMWGGREMSETSRGGRGLGETQGGGVTPPPHHHHTHSGVSREASGVPQRRVAFTPGPLLAAGSDYYASQQQQQQQQQQQLGMSSPRGRPPPDWQ